MKIRFRFKEYPGCPELTAKSRRVGTMTHPMYGLILGAIPGVLGAILFPDSVAVPLILLFAGIAAGPILLLAHRKKVTARLDARYAEFLRRRAVPVPQPVPQPVPLPVPLTRDLQLGCHSISARDGHYGTSIQYLHEKRVVEEHKWGCSTGGHQTNERRTVAVPPQVQTDAELMAWLRQSEPGLYTSISALSHMGMGHP